MARYGMLINTKKCVGCYACRVACQMVNGLESDEAFIKFDEMEQGVYPNVYAEVVPVQCMHCEDAPCVHVCPTGASYIGEGGVVRVDESKCIGCQYCLYACPYGVRTFSEADGVARKCTLCQHLTANGSAEPACVHNCPGGARFYGDLDDPNSSVSRELAKYGDDCIHSLVAPEGEEPLTRYILSPSVASWKELV